MRVDSVAKLESYKEGLKTTAAEKDIEIKEVMQRIAEAKADLQVRKKESIEVTSSCVHILNDNR